MLLNAPRSETPQTLKVAKERELGLLSVTTAFLGKRTVS